MLYRYSGFVRAQRRLVRMLALPGLVHCGWWRLSLAVRSGHALRAASPGGVPRVCLPRVYLTLRVSLDLAFMHATSLRQ